MGSQFEVECCSPFLPLELRVERCSEDRTLGSFDTFIHEGMKTEYLSSRCFHVFHVRAVFLSLFFFFQVELLYAILRELGWIYWCVVGESVERWVKICFREIRGWRYEKMYLWSFRDLKRLILYLKNLENTIFRCF